jgi:hypothetical protein
LILCINTKRELVTPEHIEVLSITNGKCLFQRINDAYLNVRKGHEAWATVAQGNQSRAENQPAQQGPPTPSVPKDDLRILARLPEEEIEWAKSRINLALREATCKALNLALADIPDIHHTATALSIRPCNKEVRQKLLAKKQELSAVLRANYFDLPTKWFNYVLPN